MNFDDTKAEAAFRSEARAWLDANAPRHLLAELSAAPVGDLELASSDVVVESKLWQKRKQQAGWACLQWPEDYGGRGASPIEQVIWEQEEGVYVLLSRLFSLGLGICGPTMMRWASEEQKRRYLPALASGDEIWCQLFSEPAAGSDLAGLRTRAEQEALTGDWIVNGQKIWTSRARVADYGLLIARTNPSVPKHQGLTMFFVNMRSPGIEVRPIKQINGGSGFGEIFLSDVRIPDAQRLGAPGQGWIVALTTLMNERMSIGTTLPTGFPELLTYCEQFDFDGRKAVDDPAVRSRLAGWAVRSSGLKHIASRAISALSKGEQPGPENSIGKLVGATIMQEVAAYALDLQGPAGALTGPWAEDSARFQGLLMRAPADRIAGGTDEILRNIIAERVLGLPADIRVDKGMAFKEIPTGKAGA